MNFIAMKLSLEVTFPKISEFIKFPKRINTAPEATGITILSKIHKGLFLVTFLEKFLPVDSIFARKSNNELEEIIYAQQDLFENFIQIMKQSLKNGINYELQRTAL